MQLKRLPAFISPAPSFSLNGTSFIQSTSHVRPTPSPKYIPQTHRSRLPVRSELTQNDTAKKSEERMEKTLANVQSNFNTIRAGRASPSILDRINVEYYGTETPLNQLASVSLSGTSTLVVEPYDKSCIGDVERAILESDVGITPSNDGSVIRLAVPPLTEERRKELVKQAKGVAESGKVALRNIRRDAVDTLKKLEKKSELGKDESKTLQDEVQKITDKKVKQIDEMLKRKEADIMKV